MFISLLDQTIVSTALSSITAAFGAGEDASWLGTAYLVTSTAVQSLYGRFSDIFGRKIALLTALGFFLLGSVLCSAAQSMTQLIVFRAIAGLGGGGIVTMVMVVVSDVVSLRERGKYQGKLARDVVVVLMRFKDTDTDLPLTLDRHPWSCCRHCQLTRSTAWRRTHSKHKLAMVFHHRRAHHPGSGPRSHPPPSAQASNRRHQKQTQKDRLPWRLARACRHNLGPSCAQLGRQSIRLGLVTSPPNAHYWCSNSGSLLPCRVEIGTPTYHSYAALPQQDRLGGHGTDDLLGCYPGASSS